MTTAAQTQITVPARAAALAWLNAFQATGTYPDRPTLHHTLALEFFSGGVQVIGCDGTALFRSWVPSVPEDEERVAEWPDQSEAPERRIVVMDPDGFGKGYMTTLLRVTGEEAHEHEELVITTASQDEDATIALGSEFMTERLILRACGQRIDLVLYEGAYPDWRTLRLGIEAIERVDSLTLATRLFALVGKLKAVSAIDLDFYGQEKYIAFHARGESDVRGLLMPMRKGPKAGE